jgi:hypothetical protein
MKPRLPTILVFLLIGALANVAVAWACAYLVPFRGFTARQYEVGSGQYWSVLCWEAFGSRRIVAVRFRPDTEERDRNRRPVLPAWSRIGRGDPLPSGSSVLAEAAEARGWPLLSMSTTFASTPMSSLDAPAAREGAAIEPPSDVRNVYDASGRNLPLRPVWWGFLGNTALYGAAAWLLVFLLLAVRRCGRARRGLCPACGYALGASAVCPECGTPRPGPPETGSEEAH